MDLQIVIFDLNGTLTDATALGQPWGRPDIGLRVLEGAVQTAMVDAHLRGCRPFAQHIRAALDLEARRAGLDAALIDVAAKRAAQLPVFPDAHPALQLLRESGLRLVTLTNSGTLAGKRTLERAGLDKMFDSILGTDAVSTFKPDPRAYSYSLAELNARPHEVLFVAAHSWDLMGAQHAGMHSAWISRGEGFLSAMVDKPDFSATDLVGLSQMVVANR